MAAVIRLVLPLLLWLAVLSPAMAYTITGTVVRVSDGDTLAVRVPNQTKLEKIRILGVDCPEIRHSAHDPGQEPWGSRAKAFTTKLVLNQQVRIETDVQARDQYHRLLGYVYVGKTFLNLELVKNGHAMVLTYAPNVKYHDAFVKAQREARAAGRGIWDPKQQLTESPHTYRHNGHHPGNGHLVDEAIREENKRPAPHSRENRLPAQTHSMAPNQAPTPAAGTSPASAPTGGNTVLLNTKSHKYHEIGCPGATGTHLVEVPRAEAVAIATPCKTCHPDLAGP